MADQEMRWDLTTIYPSLESPEYSSDKDELLELSRDILDGLSSAGDDTQGIPKPGEWLENLCGKFARLSDLYETLESYVYSLWSTDTGSEETQKELDDLESRSLQVKDALVRFRALLPSLEKDWSALTASENLAECRFWLDEQLQWARHQMSPEEEALAADLQRSGGDAWDRLHGKLSSSLSRDWDGEKKTLTELRALAYDSDRELRRRAWSEECALLKDAEISFAAALNGVKGCTASLNERRGWGSTLEKSLFQNRLSRPALDAMLGSMTQSLPMFRRYFRSKAARLGIERLSWYDLFAPLGESQDKWTWERVREFIPRMFAALSPQMRDFATKAFDERWIDVRPREGKVGGAYCVHFPLAKESRVLCNFDGSFDSVSTVAHELGHAWHGEVMKELGALNREYPMTLAETASIFAETLVFRAALEETPESDRPAVLDTYLMGASQVIVDILSRFHFESALMRSRPDGELSPRELSEMMLDAQNRSYGDALAEDERHPWMWAVKGHYYSPDLAFYNFPYAFGQLFALGLYAQFAKEGEDFADRYAELLRHTGSAAAVDVARSAGFNIESVDFWRDGIAAITDIIEEFESS